MKRILGIVLCLALALPMMAQEEALCMDGTLLFREDFGGNDPSDPVAGTDPVPGMTSSYMQIYDTAHCNGRPGCTGMDSGRYLVTKVGYRNSRGYNYSHWFIMDDHTYPNDYSRGYLLEIDGRTDGATIYETVIDGLCEGSKLTFSAYVVNVTTSHSYDYDRNNGDPQLSFVLTDPETGAELATPYKTGPIPVERSFQDLPGEWRYSANWHLVGMNFTVPAGKTAIKLIIKNACTAYNGNDFAIDDIEIRLCAPPVTIEGETEVCEHTVTSLRADFTNDGTFPEPLEYKWWHSEDSVTWTELSETTGVLTLPNILKTDSGWYKVAVAGAGNIESVNCRTVSEPFRLKVKECYYIVTETLVACHEDSVVHHGKKYAAPGNYCDTVIVANAQDTIYHLTVTDNRSFKEITLTIMSGSMVPPIGVLTESGVYQFVFTNALGCDSIVTWYVTVTERCVEEQKEYYLMGPGQSYHWSGQELSVSGDYTDTLWHRTNEECDTAVHLHLEVLSVDEIDWQNDCDGFDLHLRLSHAIEATRIVFSDAARAAGLRDTVLPLHASQADLYLPYSDVHAGEYTCVVYLENKDSTLYAAPFGFTLLYPSSVLEQGWNDMVAVLTHDYNGGYDFVAYQWYENGEALRGETGPYLYRPLIMGGEYSALLTEPDGTQRMSCPLVATSQTDISLYPTVLSVHRMIRCRVNDEAEMQLYDAFGRLVGHYVLPPGDTEITAPGATGVYIARLQTKQSKKHQTYKLIVR